MKLNLPPVRKDGEVFAPAGVARRDYPELTDDEFIAKVCQIHTERQAK
jgi:hypothetical protein